MGGSIVVSLPKIWTMNKDVESLQFVDFYLDGNQDLIVKPHKVIPVSGHQFIATPVVEKPDSIHDVHAE